MTFLPIVERELRIGARRTAPRYVRLIVAAVALVIGLVQLAFAPFFSSSGSGAFAIMTGYAFLLCVAVGIFVTADCLSEEKRGGTLGLLFLTDLRGYDVVLGKLASQVLHLGYALLAIIPGAALPLLLGGVTGGELWRISLALLNLLFFSLATGVFASSVCRQAGHAMMLTALSLACFCLGLPFLENQMQTPGSSPSPGLSLGLASPAMAYLNAMESAYQRTGGGHFWYSLGGSHAMAWLLITLASAILPRSWQERALHPAWHAMANPGQADLPLARLVRKREILNEDPVLWLIGERKAVRAAMWTLGSVAGATAVLTGLFGTSDTVAVIAVAGYIMLFLVKVLFTVEACRFFTETRQAGAFELLLATPMNANRLVSAQWTALRKLFGLPLLVALAGMVLGVGASIFVHGENYAEMSFLAVFGGIGAVFVLLVETLDFLALGWLGMWLALTLRKPHLAAGATLLYVVLLPWAACHFGMFISFVLDIVLIAVFADKLHTDLRQVIMNRPLLANATPGART